MYVCDDMNATDSIFVDNENEKHEMKQTKNKRKLSRWNEPEMQEPSK